MLQSLRLIQFRCFEEFSIQAPPAGIIITGDNARGKTSILEAICMLVRLHSPRTSRLGMMARLGQPHFGIAGDPWGVASKVYHGNKGLIMEANQTKLIKKSDYLKESGTIVWLGNEDLQLIRGSGEVRRYYLDFLGSQLDVGYREVLLRYRRALKAKNVLLKDARSRQLELRSYEAILIEAGNALMVWRRLIVEQLQPLVQEVYQAISQQKECVQVSYVPSCEAGMEQGMHAVRELEKRQRMSVVGIHRDELMLRLNTMPAVDFASEGQQRTLAIALKLAQGKLLRERKSIAPMYLIDDVFGELDIARRNALLECLPTDAQIWITTTSVDWLNSEQFWANRFLQHQL